MNHQYVFQSVFRSSFEWISFLIVVIVLFNMTTDFLQKLGIISSILSISEIQYYGFLSILLGMYNVVSKKFFSLEIFKSDGDI